MDVRDRCMLRCKGWVSPGLDLASINRMFQGFSDAIYEVVGHTLLIFSFFPVITYGHS
jgi:hypothetical protein